MSKISKYLVSPAERAQQIAQGFIDSPQYIATLMERLLNGTLPPSLELEMWNRFGGKVTDKLEVTRKNIGGYENMTEEQLAQLASDVQRALEQGVTNAQDSRAMMTLPFDKARLEMENERKAEEARERVEEPVSRSPDNPSKPKSVLFGLPTLPGVEGPDD